MRVCIACELPVGVTERETSVSVCVLCDGLALCFMRYVISYCDKKNTIKSKSDSKLRGAREK